MKVQKPKIVHSTLRQRFKLLIEALRSNTVLDPKPLNLVETNQNNEQRERHESAEITPATQNVASGSNLKGDQNAILAQESCIIEGIKDLLGQKTNLDSEIQIKEKSTLNAEEEINYRINRYESKLLPQKALECPVNEGRSGQIKRQSTSINLRLSKRVAKEAPNIRYSKVQAVQDKATIIPEAVQRSPHFIKQLDDNEVIKYWNNNFKLTVDSSSSQIQHYFQRMRSDMLIEVDDPQIRKYKNCVYFGERKGNWVHQGILYYYEPKLYYGEFLNGVKHGHGVEINFNDNVKFAGVFNSGSKNGYFFVQKLDENYEGTLQYGLYHGTGKLMTEDYVYTGFFQNGKKHGYGQEYYPKTGMKLKGYFIEGGYSHLNEVRAKKQMFEDTLPGKTDRMIGLKKSGSQDVRTRKISKLQETNKVEWPQYLLQNQQSNVKEIQFQTDSRSLFDLIQHRKRGSQYDIYVEKAGKRMPKVSIADVERKKKSRFNPEESAAAYAKQQKVQAQKYFMNSRSKFANDLKIVQPQTNDEPLSQRKRCAESPIHRF